MINKDGEIEFSITSKELEGFCKISRPPEDFIIEKYLIEMPIPSKERWYRRMFSWIKNCVYFSE